MGDIAILAEGVSKTYQIGPRQGPHYHTLRDALMATLLAPLRRSRAPRSWPTTFHALSDVSFEVGHGETVGLIGRNGAGKSTLLKILSRITEPTAGRVRIRGRVASLLEVGTGFHFELTGRENIYLSSAILGMRRAETNRRFDEIVSFAEIDEFIDTPVKHYSTGMYLRLAFAVAAHLETEVLIVDEVLAVGDARFQKKCLNKMQDVGQQGRSVLFVSHNMPAITRLCERVLLLDGGRLIKDGAANDVVNAYLQSGVGTAPIREWLDAGLAPGGEITRLRAIRVRGAEGRVDDVVDIRKPVGIEVEYEILQPDEVIMTHISLQNEDGIVAFSAFDTDPRWRSQPRPRGRYVTTAEIPGNLLAEGMFFVTVGQVTRFPGRKQFHERDVIAFRVVDNIEGDSARGDYTSAFPGVVRPRLSWTTRPQDR